MKKHDDNILSISRREFLLSTTGICFSFVIPTEGTLATPDNKNTRALSAWVEVEGNNQITILSPAAEMGQGSMTAIPMIFAEEFDVDWNAVRIEFSPADDAYFKNPTSWIHGIMLTLGSSTVSGYYDAVRLYGAQARKILLVAASKEWQVPLSELQTAPSKVVHPPTARVATYGELVALIDKSQTLPEVSTAELKSEDEFRIIGSDVPRYDIPEKVAGKALYSIDVDLPKMLYATVIHSPVKGEVPLGIKNAAKIKQRSGIVKIVTLDDAVAIVAHSYDAAYKAEKLLQIEWSKVGKLNLYNNRNSLELHLKLLRDADSTSFPIQTVGNINSAFSEAHKTWQAEYTSDYLYHAQMEPLNAVADVNVNEGTANIWVGTQAPTHCVRAVAKELGFSTDKINLHRTYLGGGFGRRGAQDHDYVLDAVRLSKRLQQPVKVIWSRETDVKVGRFKPMKTMSLKAAENSAGKLIAWHHRTVSDEALKQSDPYRYAKDEKWPVISSYGINIDYDIENILAEVIDPDTGVRVAPLRGIGGTINKFAAESFLDEIATDKNLDPLQFRLQLLHKHVHAQRTLNAVAEMSDWGKQTQNNGLGLAFDSVYSPTSYVIKVGLDEKRGIISVTNVWVAVDIGIAIHPQNIIAQIQGQVIFAISNVLKERISFTNGMVDQSNFHDYPIMRMSEIPDIKIKILTRKNSQPLGVGDSLLNPIPAAIANGFAGLTGKRIRNMPFTPSRVLKTLHDV